MNKLYNLEYLEQLADGDVSFKQEMIRYFHDNSPSVISEMDQLLDNSDWAAIRELIHRYISNLNMIGAEGIIPVACEIEKLAEEKDEVEKIPQKWKEVRNYCNQLLIELKKDFKEVLN